jgi:hypothetical protein
MTSRLGVWVFRCALALACAVCVVPSSEGWAQGKPELQSSLRQAMEAYDGLEFSESERRLEDAIALAERLGLDEDPISADLYIFLGVVRFTLSGEDATAKAFQKGLEINPSAQINPDYATPDLERILRRVKDTLPPKIDTTPPTSAGRQIEHTPVETANAGQPIVFEAAVPPTVPLYRMQLNIRRYGERDYKAIDMEPISPTRFRAILSGKEVRTAQIDYFIEALDRTGGLLVATGGPLSPLNVIVFGGEKGGPIITDPGDGPEDPDPTPSGPRQYVFLQVSAGGGFGLATGTPVVMKQLEINPGLAPAPFHVVGELGVMITESLHLSGFYRKQIVELEDLFGGKLRWWFDSESSWRAYTAVGGGYGHVRHTVDLRPAAEFVDTTREGPLHGGVGFGFGYAFNDHTMLCIDFYTLILFPTISAHMDANLGFRVSF